MGVVVLVDLDLVLVDLVLVALESDWQTWESRTVSNTQLNAAAKVFDYQATLPASRRVEGSVLAAGHKHGRP